MNKAFVAAKLIAEYWDDVWRWLRRKRIIKHSREKAALLFLLLMYGCTSTRDWMIDTLDNWAGYEGGDNVSQVD